MLNSKDKDLQVLKESHLMQVTEFHKMILALQRFKEELAVKAIAGKLYENVFGGIELQ